MMGFRFASTSLIPSLQALDAISNWAWSLVNLSGNIISYMNHYVNKLLLPFSSTTSIIGFMLLLTIALQLVSGFFLGWYYIPEPGLVIELREEMFNDTRFGLEVFYMHVRGVDSLFVLTYLHILKKIFIKNYIVMKKNIFSVQCCVSFSHFFIYRFSYVFSFLFYQYSLFQGFLLLYRSIMI